MQPEEDICYYGIDEGRGVATIVYKREGGEQEEEPDRAVDEERVGQRDVAVADALAGPLHCAHLAEVRVSLRQNDGVQRHFWFLTIGASALDGLP